jgi:hypothetical protein
VQKDTTLIFLRSIFLPYPDFCSAWTELTGTNNSTHQQERAVNGTLVVLNDLGKKMGA